MVVSKVSWPWLMILDLIDVIPLLCDLPIWYFISDIEGEFKKQLATLVPKVLAPKNLVVKEISGQKVKAKELVQYFKSYIQIYKGSDLPEPKSMLEVRYFVSKMKILSQATGCEKIENTLCDIWLI
jgi:hypothetical protein